MGTRGGETRRLSKRKPGPARSFFSPERRVAESRPGLAYREVQEVQEVQEVRGLLEKKNGWTYNTSTGRRNILESEETRNGRMLDSWGYAALIKRRQLWRLVTDEGAAQYSVDLDPIVLLN